MNTANHNIQLRIVVGLGASLLVATMGCYTTTASREAASRLAIDVNAYKRAQKERVDRINADFHDSFARLMAAYETATTTVAAQSRDQSAQRIADDLISDSKASLRQRFRDAFARSVEDARAGLRRAQDAVTEQRTAYVKSYRDLQASVGTFEKVEQHLRALSEKEDQTQTVATFIQTVIKVHQALQEEARKKAGNLASTAPEASAKN